jgi:hypothetical protein
MASSKKTDHPFSSMNIIAFNNRNKIVLQQSYIKSQLRKNGKLFSSI